MGRRKKSPLKPPQKPPAVVVNFAVSKAPADAEAPAAANEEGGQQRSPVGTDASPSLLHGANPKTSVTPSVEEPQRGELRPQDQPLDTPIMGVHSGSSNILLADTTEFPTLVSSRKASEKTDQSVLPMSAVGSKELQGKSVTLPDAALAVSNATTSTNKTKKTAPTPNLAKPVLKSWAECVTGKPKSLQMRGNKYRDESGELCVTIPNAVITRNKKAWDNFVLGQFHGTLPSMGALHAILNGIWSNKLRDIAISRVGTQSVLIKIPNANTRKRVLGQSVWHVEGQSMFVAAWEPGLQLEIPELKEVPVWVDFKGVPLHFFSEEGLEYIASLVGQPLQLHPRTAEMLNLEVARVFTLVDLTQPLPEAVYVVFESGEKQRIEVSCPWLPPKCSHCQQIGHSLRRCPTAPILCNNCKSTTHEAIDCFRSKSRSGPPPRRQEKKIWKPVSDQPTTMPKQSQVPQVDKDDSELPVPAAQAVEPTTENFWNSRVRSEALIQDASIDVPAQNNQVVPNPENENTILAASLNQTRNGMAALATQPKHGITIKEPSLSECLPKTLSKVDGKGKTKVLRHSSSDNDSSEDTDDGAGVRHELAETSRNKGKAKVTTEPLFSEYDSYDLTDDDFNEHMLLSKLKQKSGRKAKGRVSSVKLFSKR